MQLATPVSQIVFCDTVSQISPLFATPRCVRGRHPRLSPNYLGCVGMAQGYH